MKDYTQHWKKLHESRELTARDFIDLAVLKAIKSKQEDKLTIVHLLLEKYFTPITNKTRLSNGASRYDCVQRQIESFKFNAKYYRNRRVIFGVDINEFFETQDEIDLYDKLWTSIDIRSLGKKYVYYFTSQDIPPVHQGVQAGHVLFKLGTVLKKSNRLNPDDTYFQWIGVPDSNSLEEIAKKYSITKKVVKFNESDLKNKLTSIAIEPVSYFQRGDLTSYELLKY